jgi:uncharacterized protein YbbC (DUF1343 family)
MGGTPRRTVLPRRRLLQGAAVLGAASLLGCSSRAARPSRRRLDATVLPALPTPTAQSRAPGSVLCGVDVLLEHLELLRHQRIGLITNQTGRSADGRRTIDLLYARTDLQLLALFSPEHGPLGVVAPGQSIANARDAQTGLPIYSLYGATDQPTAAMLAGLDALVYDLQDVGARYYTYIWTMALAMQSAAERNLRFIVLDRPDPLGGMLVQGNLLDSQFASRVGLYPVPMRYGMTPGELADFLNIEHGIHADLAVVTLAGWQRSLYYDQTSLAWISPSPNMPDLESALQYPGTCLFEGTNLSVGRGTSRPFQQIGAPWLRATELAQRLQAYALGGVHFEAVSFTPVQPDDGKYSGETVYAVRFSATDRSLYDPVNAALAALIETAHLHPDQLAWNVSHFDALAGSSELREQILAGASLAVATQGWAAPLAAFNRQRSSYLLYPNSNM